MSLTICCIKKYETCLKSELISKQSSIQRKGRVGRLKEGFYYPICTQSIDLTVDLLSHKLDPLNILKLEKDIYNKQIDYLQKCMIIDDNLDIIDEKLLNIRFKIFKNNLLLTSSLKILNIMVSQEATSRWWVPLLLF